MLQPPHSRMRLAICRSQSPVEQHHIRGAFRFGLTKVQGPAVREQVVAMLLNVDSELAKGLAADLGMRLPKPMPRAQTRVTKPEVERSPALSLMARPGDGTIRMRGIAILVSDGVDGEAARALYDGVSATMRSDEPDPGVLIGDDVSAVLPKVLKAIARHRHCERELDPPAV